MGANSALLDACNLGEGLLRGIEAREDLQWVLQKYEEVMIPRGRQRVLEARETGNSTDASQIAGGRLPDAQTHASSLPT